jgi:single-stranded-DNA-specific exonuclease
VASRLIETYYRPTLVFTKSGDKYAASARSVKGFDIYNALEACAEHLEQFGGHMYAAGMTLHAEKYLEFKEAFEKVVRETIHPDLLVPEVAIDAAIDFKDITPKLSRILKQFEPFTGNMTPVFISKGVFDTGYAKTIGKDDEHLKLFVKQKDSSRFRPLVLVWEKNRFGQNRQLFEAAYCIEENEWNGKVSPNSGLKTSVKTNKKVPRDKG